MGLFKGRPFFLLLVCFITLLLLAFFYYPLILETIKLAFYNNYSTSSRVSISNGFSDFPDLPKFVQWKEERIDVNYEGGWSYEFFAIAKGNFRQIKVPGILYTARIENLQKEDVWRIKNDFMDYYINSLRGSEWKESIDYDDYRFDGSSAAGVKGSSYGYLVLSDDSLKTLIIGYGSEPWTVSGRLEPDCPCYVDLRVFHSETIDLKKELN